MQVKCRHNHDALAVAVWYMPNGCLYFTDPMQALCEQHMVQALNSGAEMTLVIELKR